MDDFSLKSDDIETEIDDILGTKSKKPAKIASPKTPVSNDIDVEIDSILGGLSSNKPQKVSSVDGILERMRSAIGQQESGNNYHVRPNTRTSATGKFQVIPANIPSWTKKYYRKALTQQEFHKNPQAQDAVFTGEMGKYLRKAKAKGVDDDTAIRMASAAWYGGEGAMHRYDDPVRFRPNEPSFREYTTKALKGASGSKRTSSPSSLAIGDSIAAGLIWHGGMGGNANKGVQRDFSRGATASVGATPKEILANIQAMPDKAVRGQSVVLSTGASNDPKSLDVIQSQIDALRKKGATNITVLGVGPHKNLAGVNDYLAKIAQDNGVTFTGALKTGKDQIHPTRWDKLAKSLPIGSPVQAPRDVDPITSIDDEIDSLLSGIPQAPEVPDGSVYNKPADTPTGLPDNSGSATGTPNEIFQSRTANLESPVNIDALQEAMSVASDQSKLADIAQAAKQGINYTTDIEPVQVETRATPKKTASTPPIDMPDAPVMQATDADFEEANKYLASVGQPQITREQFDVAQKTVGKNAQATGYETQAEVPQQGQPAQQSQQRPQEIRGPVAEREPTKWKGASTVLDDDQLLKTDLSYVIDLSQVKGDKKAYAVRAGQNALMKQWGLTAEQAAKFISANAAPYTDADKATRILVNRGELADLIGADRVRQDYDEERAGVTQDWYQANDGDVRAQKANKPTFDDVSRADFYRPSGDELLDEARYNVIQSPPTMGSEDDAIRQEYERLKKYSLTEDEKAEMTRAGENTANWFSPKASAALSGAMGGGGRVLNWLAGALRLDQSNPLSPLQLLPESWTIALAKTGNKMTGASAIEAKKNPGFANAAIRIVSGLPYDLPRYALLSRLPGGAVAMFAADSGLQSAGRGERADTVIAETTKGAAMGAIFKGSGKLYNKVEDFALKAFKNPVFDRASKGTIPDEKLKNLTDALKFDAKTEMRMASDPAFKAQVMADVRAAANEEWQKQILLNPQVIANTPKERLAAKLFGEGAKVGAIGTGTAYLTRVTSKASTPEEANEEAWNEGVTMALTSLALDHGKGVGKGIKDLAGRIYRATVGTKTADVTVMPNGDIKLLKGAVPDDVVDASVRVDNGEASFNEQAKSREDISKSQKEGEAKLNNEIFKRQQAEKVTKERGLPEAPPKRVESPTTEAVTKATNHPVAQRVSTILADGKPRTLDDIARESRLKSADKISEAIDTLYAAGQIQINPDGTVQINGGERPDTSLYDQFDASGRIKPTTVPTTPVAPAVNTQDDDKEDEILSFTPTSTPKVDTKEYPPSGLPALVEADIRKDKFIHPQKNITDLAEQMGKTPDEIREILPTLPDYTDAQIAKKYGVTEEQVANLRPLGEIGHDGYTSHRVRATVLDPANEGMFNTLSDIFTGGEVRFRDAEFETKGRMADAVLNKIAESVGKPRASQMTSQDWSKVLSVHADKLNIDDVDKLVAVAEEGKEYTKKFNALVTSPRMQAIVAQGMRDFGAVVNADGTIEYHGAPMTWEDLLEVDDNASGRKTGQTRSGGVTLPLRKMALALGKELGGIKENGKPLFTNEAIRRAHDTAVYARTGQAPKGGTDTRQVATVSASSSQKPSEGRKASASSTQKVAPIKVVKKSELKSEPKTETKTEPKKAPVVAEKAETREGVAPEPKKATEVKEKPKKPTLEGTKEEIKKEKVETLHSIPVTAKGQSTADAQVFIEADIDPTVKLTPNKTSSVWRVKSPDGIEVKGATYKEALDIAQRIADGLESGAFFSRPRRAPATVGARAHNLTRDAGGTTLGLRGDEPKTGIAFAPTKGTERVVAMADFTPESVDDFIETHRVELEKPGRYFGAWWNQEDGKVYMDISEVGDYTPETIQRAIDAKQLAAFDLGAMEEIPLGKMNAKGYTPLYEATAHPYLNSRQNLTGNLRPDESGDEPSRERGGDASSRRHVEASTILRESGSSATPELGRYSYGRDKAPFEQEIKRQEDALERYAREKGIWLDADALQRFELLNDPMAAGGESVVYLNEGNKTVTKFVNPRAKGITPFGTPQQFIDNRISLYNEIFPETPYTLKQIARDKSGEFQFVLEQPFVIGTNPTNQKPIDDYMDSKGYYPYGFQGQYTNGIYKVIDLTPKNVLITEDGIVIPVDAITRPDEEALASEKGSFFSRPNVSTTAVLSQIKPYTTTVLTKLKQFQGRDVKIQTVRETLKQGGIKAQDKKMIERILSRPEFADGHSIPYDELDKAIRLEVMPLQVIETQTYADYGKQNVGISSDSTKTYIFNSPVSHGYKGHFSGDFDRDVTSWEIKEAKDKDTGEVTYLAVPTNQTFQGTTEAEAMGFVGTASQDKGMVEEWINNAGFRMNATNEGLYGHSRVWRDGKDSYNAEDQSDTYQKQNLERMLIESYLNDYRNNKLKIGDVTPELYTTLKKLSFVQQKTKSLIGGVKNPLWNAIPTVDGAFIVAKEAATSAKYAEAMLDSLSKKTAPAGVLEKWDTPDDRARVYLSGDEADAWVSQIRSAAKIRSSDSQALISVGRIWSDMKHSVEDDVGDSPTKWEIAQRVIEDAQSKAQGAQRDADKTLEETRLNVPEYMTYERLVEDEKDLTKDVTKFFTSTDEQFIAHKKNYIARILRETIRIEALADQERFLIPTALTAARIEGFVAAKRARGGTVGTSNEVYEVEDARDEDTLVQGDTIRMGGHLYHVAEATDDTIEVVPDDEVYSYTYGDFAEGEYEKEYANLQYEARREEGTWMSPKQLTDFIKDELYLYDIDSDDYAEMFVVIAPNPDYDPEAADGSDESVEFAEFDPGEYDGDPSDIEEFYFSQTRPFISAVENELSQREYDLGEYMTNHNYSWELPSGDGYYYSDAQSETFDQPWVIREREEEAQARENELNEGVEAPPEVKKLGRDAIEQPVMKDFSDERQTILKKYIELENLFFDEREDVEIVEDKGGNQWLASPLTEADKGDVVVFNKVKEDLDAENEYVTKVLSQNFGGWEGVGRGAQAQFDGDVVWLSPEANRIVENVFQTGSIWTGVYNTISGTTALYKGLANFHTAALENGDTQLAKGIERVFEGIVSGIDDVYGDVILYTELPDAPNTMEYGVQEERLHRADLRLRKVASWRDIPVYEENPAYNQAARNLSEGAYAGADHITIHHEIVAKMFRDDAEIELGLTYNQLQSIRLLHYDQLIANGVTDAEIEKAYQNISKNASQWVAAQRSQAVKSDARGVNSTRGSPNAPQFSRLQSSGDGRGKGVNKALAPYPFARDIAQNVDEKGQRIPQALFSRPTNVAGDAFPDIESIPEEELTMEAHRTRIEKVLGDVLPNFIYDGRREVTPAEAIGNTVRAGYLLGVSVVLTNVQGNPVNQVVEQGVKVFSGPLDWLNSKINPKSGYERHNPGLSLLDIAEGMFGKEGALRKTVLSKGKGSIYEVLRKGVGDEEREKFDLLPLVHSSESKKGRWDENVVRNTGIPTWDLAIEASVRISSALDRPFKAFKNASEIRGLARLTATKLRKQGAISKTQYYDFVKQLNKDPNAWMEAVAKRSAQIDTFQNPNAITDEINKIKKKLLTGRFASDVQDVQARQDAAKLVGQLLYLVMTSTAPFLNTPANIGIRALEYTPVGLALGAVRFAKIGKTLERLEWAEKMAERRKKEDSRVAKERLQENRDIKSILDKYSAQKKAKKAERDQAIADIEASTVMTDEFKKARIKKAKENYKAWEAGWTEAKAKRAQVVDSKLADAGTERAKIDAGIAADRAREDAEANRKFTALENNAFTSGLGRTAFGTTFGSLFFLGVFMGILEAVGYVNYDDDQTEWEKRRDAGIPDASIGVLGYRFPYDNSPLGKALAIGVTAMEQAQRGGSVEKRAEGSAKGVVKGLRNLFPYTENRFDTQDEWLEIGKTIKSVTPFVNMKILEEAANIIDDKPRTTFKQGMTAPFKMTFAREGIPMLGIDPLPVTKHPMGKRHDSMLWRGLQTINPMRSIKQVKEKDWKPSPHKK